MENNTQIELTQNNNVLTEPLAIRREKIITNIGNGLVTVTMGAIALITSGSLIAIGSIAVLGLGLITYIIPVSSRYLALKKQQALIALAENYSVETIQLDEQKRATAIEENENKFKQLSASCQNAITNLTQVLDLAKTQEEKDMLNNQIELFNSDIKEAENSLKKDKEDFEELKRVNKLLIALNAASNARLAMSANKKQNAIEKQQLEAARKKIINNMNQADAQRKIDAIDSKIQNDNSTSSVFKLRDN